MPEIISRKEEWTFDFENVLAAVREGQRRDEVSFSQALESEEGFLAWATHHSRTPCPPIVRAATYARVWKWQEFVDSYLAPDDPRRPVVMRGAVEHMRRRRFDRVRRYSQEVTRRYLRRYGLEGNSIREIDAICKRIFDHMERRKHLFYAREIRALAGAGYDHIMENHRLRKLTISFKRLLKEPTDKRAERAAALLEERF